MGNILGVLVRRGLASVVSAVILGEKGGRRWVRRHARSAGPTAAQHLRLALEELGTTFVKLGQILSTRGDILPPEYQRELARLQDAESPEDVETIRAVIAAELGQPVDVLYASFTDEPLAAASIGQAHAATTLEGLDVVVKVRRPGVVAQVECDLALVNAIARVTARWTRLGRRHHIEELADEFAATLTAELDYVREARNAERFANAFAHDAGVHIPLVVWPLTTHRVLTIERIRGIKVTDRAALDAAGVDRSDLARRAATIEMKMIFADGFFHADPHPGNFFVEADGRIGLLDFGMVGEVDNRTRGALVRVMGALATRDGDALVAALESLGIAGFVGAGDRLRYDLLQLADTSLDQPLGDLAIGPMLHEMIAIVRRHHLRLPPNLALMVKTIAMCEGVCAQLDPSFRLVAVLLPFVDRFLADPASEGT